MAVSNADGSIILKTQVDQTGLNKGMATMKSGVKSLTGAFVKLGSAVGLAMGISAMVQFGKEAINLASDLEEVQNVVDVAFGEMSYKIEQFSKTAIENFGISELTAKRTASTYMAMAKGMGIVDDVASDMAITMTGLTADLASFYNISQERADVILKSVYTGETETLKQLGIVMTEVNLQNFAMSQGITKNISKMTQQEKTMLRYQYVLQQTALAQGDFSRTSDSWANQTRILAERWKQFQSILGEAFIAIGTLVLPVVNTIITALTRLAEIARNVAQLIYKAFTGKELKTTQAQAGAIADVGINSAEASDGMSDLGKETEKAGKKAKKFLAGFDELNTITEDIAENASDAGGGLSDFGDIGGGLSFEQTSAEPLDTSELENSLARIEEKLKTIWNSEPIQAFVGAVKTSFDFLSNYISTMWSNVKTNTLMTWQNIQGDLQNIGQNLVTLWTNVWTDFTSALNTWGQPIINSISNLFNSIWATAIDPAVKFITSAWSKFTDIMVELWNEHGEPLFNNIGEFAKKVIDLFKSIYDNVLEPIITPLLENMTWLWNEHLSVMVGKLWDFILSLVNGALEIYNKFIGPIVKFLLEILSPAWTTVTNFVIGVVADIVADISDLASSLLDVLKGIVNFIVGVFTRNWKKAWNGVKTIFKGIADALVTVLKSPLNKIITMINSFISGINKIRLPNWEALGSLAGRGINIPKIPRLAQGTVIPGGREFMAILGDQPRGQTNIEAPLDTIKQAVAEVVANMNVGNGFNGRIEVPVYINGRQIALAVREAENNLGSQTVFGGFANAY
jgi:hypothetical protein